MNLGTILNKNEQKGIFGGGKAIVECLTDSDCGDEGSSLCCFEYTCWFSQQTGDFSVCTV